MRSSATQAQEEISTVDRLIDLGFLENNASWIDATIFAAQNPRQKALLDKFISNGAALSTEHKSHFINAIRKIQVITGEAQCIVSFYQPIFSLNKPQMALFGILCQFKNRHSEIMEIPDILLGNFISDDITDDFLTMALTLSEPHLNLIKTMVAEWEFPLCYAHEAIRLQINNDGRPLIAEEGSVLTHLLSTRDIAIHSFVFDHIDRLLNARNASANARGRSYAHIRSRAQELLVEARNTPVNAAMSSNAHALFSPRNAEEARPSQESAAAQNEKTDAKCSCVCS